MTSAPRPASSARLAQTAGASVAGLPKSTREEAAPRVGGNALRLVCEGWGDDRQDRRNDEAEQAHDPDGVCPRSVGEGEEPNSGDEAGDRRPRGPAGPESRSSRDPPERGALIDF